MTSITTTPASSGARACSELKLLDYWDSDAVRSLIQRKTKGRRKPAFLFIGRHEAQLLRRHLGAAFGPESVQTLKNLYYMGLEVVEVEASSYFRTAGIKRVHGLTEALNRRPGWKELEASSFWIDSVR